MSEASLLPKEQRPLMDELLSDAVTGRLKRLGIELAGAYQNADPFPHVVIDQLLPDDLLQEALDAFPKPRVLPGQEWSDKNQVKLQYNQLPTLPQPLRELILFLNSPPVLQFLEKMTG